MPRLANKTALITGGTSGIGLATALRFMEEGARVMVTGTDAARNAKAQEALGKDAIVVASNAGSVTAQADLARQVGEKFGKLDVLFLNAGIADLKPLEAWTEQEFDRSLAINLKGPFFLIKALLPVFGAGASIVLNGSINAHIGMPTSSVYAATKAGMVSLGRTLSGELIGRGIRANVISAGPIETPLHDKTDKPALAKQIPAGRFGHADEIAAAAVYFASDESRFTVGAEIIVDGGMSTL